jgi:hypothetical protein
MLTGTDDLMLGIPGKNIDGCDLSSSESKLELDLESHIWIGDVVCD